MSVNPEGTYVSSSEMSTKDSAFPKYFLKMHKAILPKTK